MTSDVPIWIFTNNPIADNYMHISTDTDNRFDNFTHNYCNKVNEPATRYFVYIILHVHLCNSYIISYFEYMYLPPTACFHFASRNSYGNNNCNGILLNNQSLHRVVCQYQQECPCSK